MDPCGHEFLAPLVPFFDGDAVPHVVLPRAVDLEVSQRDAFLTDLELLHHPSTVAVPRDDADLEPVQVQFLEREAGEDGDAFVGRYLDFLAAGGSAEPADLLRPLGVDLADPGCWDPGFREMERMVERAEEMTSAA